MVSPRCWSQVSRNPSGRPAKRTGRCSFGHAAHCLALHSVGLGDAVGPCGYRLHSACLAEGLRLQDLPLEQYRARDELPLMQQWPHDRVDDRVSLSADLETMDLLTTAPPPPTLSAAEPLRLQNDFEDFFGTRRPQLISSAEIALPLLTSWDSLVVDKPDDARPRSDKSTEQVLPETTRPCPRYFISIRQAGGVRAHDVRQSPLSARILLALPP